jgi:hypothetical protein
MESAHPRAPGVLVQNYSNPPTQATESSVSLERHAGCVFEDLVGSCITHVALVFECVGVSWGGMVHPASAGRKRKPSAYYRV